MKETELRIGNWIKTPIGAEVLMQIVAREIFNYKIENEWLYFIKTKSSYWDLDCIKGILINEEILLKWGFQQIDKNKKTWKYDWITYDNHYCKCYLDGYGLEIDKIIHVHEMQNLLFALNKKELPNIEI